MSFPPSEFMARPGPLVRSPNTTSATLEELIASVVKNYAEYRTTRRRLIELQTWILKELEQTPGDL